AVRREDRSDRCVHGAAARERVSSHGARPQQFTEIANAHSCRWDRHGTRIAGAAEDGCAVALAVERKEEERTIAAVVKRRRAFAEARQEDWTADRAVVIVGHVVR